MQINKVTYSRLVSFGHYEDATFGGEAVVEDGETPEWALTQLRLWVDAEAEKKQRARNGEQELRDIESELIQKRAELERLHRSWEKAKAFLERHGVVVDEQGYPDDLPF